ncbi:uncharacterized protein LOC100834325 [Brachypodium distachyon]|uniref:Uncharacterized protein n=1 Tax=Brachypodium distachyon TaxID=15368 RepID=I1I7A0_BRADI|nr:uncharacterized protein LOC100834325 [Brachypodium distachyon]KQJ98379.1 hypothetical protein BRADI_3g36550v3 [Brachypodium distachyon]|eukprot:XP_003572222.1 uncharacterized protein LOC100834325 [Brachypodium distachyon]
MGRLQEHFSSNAGDTSPFLGPSPPLFGCDSSSPSPLLLPAPPGGKRGFGGRRSSRHVIVKLICSPFAAVFRTTCSPRAHSIGDDDDLTSGAGDEQEGQAARRRPRLEELLKMESASSDPEELIKKPTELVPADMDDSWKESAIVVFEAFGDEKDDTSRTTGEEEEEEEEEDDQLEYALPPGRQMAIVRPAGLGVSQTAVGGGAALMNVKRLVLLLEAMRARSMALKVKAGSSSSYWRLSGPGPGPGGRAADKKADQLLFYDRPIPLGRRCRVQHLQETSPYQ